MILRSVHRSTAILIALFAAFHIANHLVALAGVPMHLAFMNITRLAYRQRLVELLLLAAVVAQLLSGLVLVMSGRRDRRGFVDRLQAVCGLYLVLFLVVHVSAVLYGRAVLGLDTNFYYAAAGFHVPPFAWFFAPYYFLAVVALFTHLGCALHWRVPERFKKLAIIVPATLGCSVSILIILTLSGVLSAVTIPDQYKASYGGAGVPTLHR